MTTSNALLASLAIIKANWDESKDTYLDNFLPFFLAAARDCGNSSLSMTDASEVIWSRFGMQIPAGVLVTLSKRAAQKSYGRRESGFFFPDSQKMKSLPDLGQQRADYLRKQSALVNELIQFSKERFGLIFTVEEAEDALLAHVEEYSTPLLGSVVLGQTYPNREDSSNQDVQYVVNSFISHVVSSLPQSFDHLEAVVKGSMLAVSLYLPNASEIGRRFERTTLFLDTPLIVRALGYEGADSKAAADDLLTLCRASGAEVACFEHNVQEVKGILDRSSRNAARGARTGTHRRPTDTHFASEGATSSDILLLAQTLEDDIAHLHIAIVEKPGVSSALTVDELDLEATMEDQMSYQSRDALLNDLDSLTAIHRLREGRSSSRLETCRAILVTSNGGLARIGQSFFVRGGDHQWPVAITDHHLATLVWLKKPHTAPDLPRRQILADCFAALEPGKRLWDRYLIEIDRLKAAGKASESDLMLLRYSTEAERSLMDRTLGNPAHVSSATVAEVLEAIKTEMITSPNSERDAALASATTMRLEVGSLQKSLRHKELTAIDVQIKQAEIESDRRDLKARVAELERAENMRRSDAASKASRHAARIHVAFLSFCAAVLVASVLALLLPPALPIVPNWLRQFSPLCLIVATIGGFITLFFGGSVKRSAELLRRAVAAKLESIYLRRAGLEQLKRSHREP